MTASQKLLMVAVAAGLLQAAVAHAAAPLPHYSLDKTLGVASCASSLCHGAIETWKDSTVLQNEYVTWSRSDKHARSYAVLLNDRSKEIAKKLALPAPAHKSDVCLDCHTHNPKPAQRGEGFQIADGVACEACHGPAHGRRRSCVRLGCTPERPLGAPMVSTEGACSAYYNLAKYRSAEPEEATR